MGEFLPCVILLEVLRDPVDFRYRQIGTKVILEMLHNDHTGKRMTELSHQARDSRIFRNCRQVTETGRPVGGRTPYIGQKHSQPDHRGRHPAPFLRRRDGGSAVGDRRLRGALIPGGKGLRCAARSPLL